MSTSPFMDDYSSEDYSDHDDDYYIVSAPTSPRHVRGQVEIQTQSNDLQNLITGQQVDVTESVYFDVLSELEAQTVEEEGGCMEQSIYLPVESYFALEAHSETNVAASNVDADPEVEAAVEKLAMGSYFDLDAHVEIGLPAALDTKTVHEEINVIESESSESVEADIVVRIVESMIKEFMLEAVEESESDLEAEDAIEEPNSNVDHAVDVGRQVETTVEERDVIGGSIYEAVGLDHDLDAVKEEDLIGESIYKGVESDYDLDAVKEGDVIIGSIYQGMESDYDLDADKEGDVIGESIYEVVGSDYDLDAEADDMVQEAIDVVEAEEDMVEGEDDMVEGEDDMVKGENDIVEGENDIVEGEDDMVEGEDDMVEGEDDMVKGEDDMVEGEDDMVEGEDDMVEGEDDMVKEKHDVIADVLEFGNSLKAKDLVEEGVVMKESIYKPLESNSDLKAQEPYFDFEPKEPKDLSDEQSDSWDDESDLSEEEWDLDVEEYSDMDPEDDSDMDSSESDQTEEEEDDVVVSYLKSSTPLQNKAWKSLVPAWAKLSVTDIPTSKDSSLLESFLGCGPMLILQDCGNAMMNVIETLLCELSRIRNDLCRVLGALFHERETTKQA